jgi:hypothetical protein
VRRGGKGCCSYVSVAYCNYPLIFSRFFFFLLTSILQFISMSFHEHGVGGVGVGVLRARDACGCVWCARLRTF